jgi:hypothetical protein
VSKQRGTYYEHCFLLECLERNLHPHPSIGDYLPHDIIVQNEAGRLFRVQIKGTEKLVTDKRSAVVNPVKGRYRITASYGRNKREPIDCKLVDVLAAYVSDQNIFYNIPCTDLSGRCVWLNPDHTKSKARYEKYKNNWDVFK